MKSWAALAAGIWLTACSGVVTSPPTGQIPITEAFATQRLRWQQQDSVTTFYFLARERGGLTEVCGAVYTDGLLGIRAIEPRIQAMTSLETADEVILNKILSFTRLNSFDENSMATCVTTQRPWGAGLASERLYLRYRFTQISI